MTRELRIEDPLERRRSPAVPVAMGPDATLAGRLWYDSVKVVVRLGMVLAFRIRYTGTESVPPKGGILVVSNHQSHLDPPLIGAGFPRRMNFLARQTLFRSAAFARLIRSLNAIPIDREGGGMAGMKETLRKLKRAEVVLIFPEGTRCHDGEIAPFRPGFATLATRASAAIVPATIEGAFHAWPRTRNYPIPRTIHVHFCPPIPPEELKDRSEEEIVREVESRVRDAQAMIRRRPPFRAAQS